jgi:5-methylcytosine-specific restriction endonuclease McrA
MKARAYCQAVHGFTCWLCGHEIAADDYDVDHVEPRSVAPHLTWEPSNWRPAMLACIPSSTAPATEGAAPGMRTPAP